MKLLNFANIDQVGAEDGPFDFVLADLGVSSMQIDNPDRGFSYKTDGPLDLRLNPQKGKTAAERLKECDVEEFAGMLMENADEPYAQEIASAVISEIRRGNPVDTTGRLRGLSGQRFHLFRKRAERSGEKILPAVLSGAAY